jgi:hypothetical protein
MCVSQNWPNLEKRPPFPQFSSKLFQRPLWPISIILNFSKFFLVKADIKQLLPKKNLRSFDEN